MSCIRKTVIKAGRPWFHVPWREIWEYRDLLLLLVRRDLTAQFKQTVFGPLLFILQPVVMALVFTVFFGGVAGISTDGIPRVPFYMCGIVFFGYFQNCMVISANSLSANAAILGKVYFPRLIVPLSSVLTGFVTFLLNLAMFLAFYAYALFAYRTTVHPSLMLVWLPGMILLCAALGLGVGLWLSALTVKYRDLRAFLPVASQLLLYATPVIYPWSSIRNPWLHAAMALNPVASVVEMSRVAFFGKGAVSLEYALIAGVVSLVVLSTGVLAFSRVERTFVDVI